MCDLENKCSFVTGICNNYKKKRSKFYFNHEWIFVKFLLKNKKINLCIDKNAFIVFFHFFSKTDYENSI